MVRIKNTGIVRKQCDFPSKWQQGYVIDENKEKMGTQNRPLALGDPSGIFKNSIINPITMYILSSITWVISEPIQGRVSDNIRRILVLSV